MKKLSSVVCTHEHGFFIFSELLLLQTYIILIFK